MTYPTAVDEVNDAVVREVMVAVGLGRLVGRLDEEAEWSTALSGGEQQRVAFARALIYRPSLLLLDDAVSMLEPHEARELYGLLAARLPEAIVISIGRPGVLPDMHDTMIDMARSRVGGQWRPAVAAVTA